MARKHLTKWQGPQNGQVLTAQPSCQGKHSFVVKRDLNFVICWSLRREK